MSTKNSFGVEMKTLNGLKSADLNGDGHVTDEEIDRRSCKNTWEYGICLLRLSSRNRSSIFWW